MEKIYTSVALVSNEVNNVVKYGRIKIETRIGILEYSYQVAQNDSVIGCADDNYQLETSLSRYHELTSDELDEIDDLITNEMYR